MCGGHGRSTTSWAGGTCGGRGRYTARQEVGVADIQEVGMADIQEVGVADIQQVGVADTQPGVWCDRSGGGCGRSGAQSLYVSLVVVVVAACTMDFIFVEL